MIDRCSIWFSLVMGDDVTTRMGRDIDSMRRQLEGKRRLLQEVFTDMETIPSAKNRQVVKEVFGVTPSSRFSTPSLISCSLASSFLFEDSCLVEVAVKNSSRSHQVLTSCQLLCTAVPVRSLLLDSKRKVVSCLKWVTCLYMNNEAVNLIVSISGDDKQNESGRLLIGFPSRCFFEKPSTHLIIDCRWTVDSSISPLVTSMFCSSARNEAPPLETHSISIEKPVHSKSIQTFLNSSERESESLLELCQLSMYRRSFPEKPASQFREMFDTFDCTDYGDWQLYVGVELHSGIIVYSARLKCGVVDTVLSRDSRSLDAFLAVLSKGK